MVLNVRMKRSNSLSEEGRFLIAPEDAELLRAHNDARDKKEREYFFPSGEKFLNAFRVLETTADGLNGPEVAAAIKEARADVALVYGTTLLKKRTLEALKGVQTINLHAGLSPWYKGSATLFWPIYFMEPQYAGCTFHVIDEKIDHGDVIHQNRPEIFANDGLHDIGCRAIVKAAGDIVPLLSKIERGWLETPIQQKKSGKVFYSWDFKPHHLRVTKRLLSGGFLGEYLQKRERFPDPPIIRQF